MSAAVPRWEVKARRFRHGVGRFGAEFVGELAWGLAVLVVGSEALKGLIAMEIAPLTTTEWALIGLSGVGIVCIWTLTTVVHEATHAVALRSRGVGVEVTVRWWHIAGYRLPIASSGICRPRGDGYAHLTPGEHLRVILAPAALAAVLTVPAVLGGVVVGASPAVLGLVTVGVWLFSGPSPIDWGQALEVALWPDEYRDESQQLARRIRNHAAAEGGSHGVVAVPTHRGAT